MKMKPIINNRIRKSGFEDIFFVIAFLMATAIFIIVIARAWNSIQDPLEDSIQGVTPSDSNYNVTKTFERTTDMLNGINVLFPLLMIGLFGFVIITAGAMMKHPIMIVVGIIVFAIAVMFAVIMSNVYHQVSDADQFASTNDNFPVMDMIMRYLPFLVIACFVIIGSVIWINRGSQSGL